MRSDRSRSTGSPRRWRSRCSRPAIGVRFCGALASLWAPAGEAGQARRDQVGPCGGGVDGPVAGSSQRTTPDSGWLRGPGRRRYQLQRARRPGRRSARAGCARRRRAGRARRRPRRARTARAGSSRSRRRTGRCGPAAARRRRPGRSRGRRPATARARSSGRGWRGTPPGVVADGRHVLVGAVPGDRRASAPARPGAMTTRSTTTSVTGGPTAAHSTIPAATEAHTPACTTRSPSWIHSRASMRRTPSTNRMRSGALDGRRHDRGPVGQRPLDRGVDPLGHVVEARPRWRRRTPAPTSRR